MLGNIWFGMLIFGLLLSIIIQIFGTSIFRLIFPQLLFEPYGQLSVWTAFFAIFSFMPLNVWQAEEKPRLYVLWTSITLLLTVAATLLFVVVLKQGAVGYLLGPLVANIILAVPFTLFTIKKIEFKMDLSYFKDASLFSIPLLPHGISNWCLALSDRAILQFYVSFSALGIYSLGYTFGMIQILVEWQLPKHGSPFCSNGLQKRASKVSQDYQE